jgi:hypothetical protein
VIVGIDFSTFAVDIVLLEEDSNHARHLRRRLDLGPGKAIDRTRRVRDAMPARGAWRDAGVTAIGIEEPFSRATMGGQVPLLITLGAIVATLPRDLPLALLRADDWRKACGLPIRGQRDQLKQASIGFAERAWAKPPLPLDDNVADAFGIAWATRHLAEIAAAA